MSLTAINKALKAAGAQEALRRGRGYFYFEGGDSAHWPETGVYACSLQALSVEQWLAERDRLAGGAQ